mgnify:CR=1 FL=1
MDDNVQNIRSGRALKGFGKVLSGLGLVCLLYTSTSPRD